MNDATNWKVPKWPFFLADGVLLAFAYYFILHAPHAIHYWEFAAACVALGAVTGIIPFILDYRVMGKALEVNALGTVAEKIQTLEKLSAQITVATHQLSVVQETVAVESAKTSAAARQIADKMGVEAKEFSDFMMKVNDSEKSTLRLEIEKLHRGEKEWLQILVHILDHIFALHAAAVRTGDPKFFEPITNFQNACRDVARRIGLTPFAAEPDEPFNAERHLVAGSKEAPPAGSVVKETVNAGYTFQGRLLRPALVRLLEPKAPAPIAEPTPAAPPADDDSDDELPL
jgi:molecular chaperone GrpE (heat shock protein)